MVIGDLTRGNTGVSFEKTNPTEMIFKEKLIELKIPHGTQFWVKTTLVLSVLFRFKVDANVFNTPIANEILQKTSKDTIYFSNPNTGEAVTFVLVQCTIKKSAKILNYY